MKEKRTLFKGFAMGIVTSLLLSLLVAPGFAASALKTIQVYTGITLYHDGVKFEPKDAGGHKVEPLLYNGTTYLPVRAISNLFGEDINWDGNTWSVYIGDMPGKKTYLGTDLKPYDCWGYDAPTTFSMDGKTYVNGFKIGFGLDEPYAIWNLDGKYKTLEFDIGHTDSVGRDKQVLIYLDGTLVKTISVKGEEMVKHVSVPLNGALQLKIMAPYPGYIGFANAQLS